MNGAPQPMLRSIIVATFRTYCDCRIEFFSALENCSYKGWPDRKLPLQKAFELQRVYVRRDLLRCESTYALDKLEIIGALTLTNIMHVIDTLWSTQDEQALRKDNETYDKMAIDITSMAGSIDGELIGGALRDTTGDPDANRARAALQQCILAVNRRLEAIARDARSH